MQVFCGITTDKSDGPPSAQGDTVCAVALVSAGGGLLATDTFGDDPRGWVRLNSLLARQTPGSSPVSVAVSDDVDQLAEFASAAGHLVVRSASPNARSKDALDDAIAIARGMATGEVGGQPVSARPEIAALRPVLDAVGAGSRARHEAAEALTCLLRAVFPAALAAWDDPSEANAVAILTRLPQPGALQSISTEELAADLATVADPGQVAAMAGALTEAIREIGGGDDPAVAPSVSATAEAVSAWDRSLEGLIGLLQAKRPRLEAAPVSAPTGAAAEEAPVEPRRRRTADQNAQTHRTVQLPGDLPDRESLRALDPASQLHGLVSPPGDNEPTLVIPPPAEGDSGRTQSIRRRRGRPAELPQGDGTEVPAPSPAEGAGRRHPWQPKDEAGDLQQALADEGDGLLIFGQAKSAWFKRPEGEEEADSETWTLPGDDGWRTARHVTEAPESEETTTATGLPKRKPQANLVPGSVVDGGEDPGFAEPIDRDPEVLAQNTAGYFKGWGRARGGGRAAAAARQAERMASR